MKKIFTLLAASLMLSANAETLTVYEGSNWDYYVPINSLWFDEADVRTQVLFPAADLNEMAGKAIKSMTFYTDDYGCYMDGGLLSISMGETDVNELETYIVDGLTEVANVSMTKHTGEPVEIKIDFETPYVYNGGNLLFDTYVAQPGNYGMTYFKGVRPEFFNALAYAYGNIQQRSFLPMTTFEYEAVDEPVDPDPENPYAQGYWLILIDKDGNELPYVLTAGSNTDWQTSVALTYSIFGTFDYYGGEPRPNVNYYFLINGVRYGAPAPETATVLGTALDNPLVAGEDYYTVPVGYNYVLGIAVNDEVENDYYVYAAQAGFVGVDELNADKAVASVRYFNVAGQEMAQPAGLTIKVTTFTDGTTSAVKVMK